MPWPVGVEKLNSLWAFESSVALRRSVKNYYILEAWKGKEVTDS